MRIVIIAPGSRGDVEPYIALGKGLIKAGNTVRLVSHENFEGLVSSHGLEFWPVEGSVQDIIQSKEMRELVEQGNFLSLMAQMAKEAQRVAVDFAKGGLAASQGMDLVLAGMGGLYTGLSLAEKLGLPLVQAYVGPFTPTQNFPSVLVPNLPAWSRGVTYRISHHLTRQMMWQMFRSADQLARRAVLGLRPAPLSGPYQSGQLRGLPVLYGFSPSFIPAPTDWDGSIHVTGYWFVDAAEDWVPPSGLTNFLEQGSAPVFVGFGSMSNRNPEETADLVIQAVQQSGQRAIIQSGWGGLRKADLPESVMMIDSVPHAWLFPKMAAVVHHGGAGTTAAGLRAGVPSVVVPFFGDQPFWGQRIAEAGVGPKPIPRKQLSVERLAQAIQTAVSDEEMRRRAASLGEKIRAEDGTARAVEIIQRLEAERGS